MLPLKEWMVNFWAFCKRNVIPDLFIKRRFNFITIHYLYIIGMSLLLSTIVFGIGGMAYIDALLFTTGGCTQSGLNPIDINLIHTGQQVMLWLAALLCNPIVIHSAVVFIRLYWFEKRFKDVVQASMNLRRTKSRSRNNTLARDDDPEQGNQPLGVRGRAIQILRHTGHVGRHGHPNQKEDDNDASPAPNGQANGHPIASAPESGDGPGTADAADDDDDAPEDHPRRWTSRSTDDVRLPQQLSPEQHIRFLENQRNPSDTTALRIPSPREYERGGRPQNVASSIDAGLTRQITSEPDLADHEKRSTEAAPRGGDDGRTHITIDEPRMLRERRDKTATFPRLNTRQSTQPVSAYDAPDPGATLRPRRTTGTLRSLQRSNTARTMEPAPYLSWQPTIGRNSFFIDLTEEQREELGGIEYRALKTLALILVLYFFGFHLLGIICLVPWILHTPTYGQVVTAQGQGRPWWGVFTSGSSFNDLGFTLTNDSMISFGTAVFPMLLMTFLIIIGNTGFPCMLRFLIWTASKCVPFGGPLWEELHFLLDHPRRCFTLLFPKDATWWLFAILVILNGVDLIFFIVLDLNDPVVMAIPPGIRFLDGLFQAASTRTAGFSVVNLAELHPAIQVSYLVMMYISVLPIAISMRRTNVYEEKSLGIYGSPTEEENDGKEPSYVGAHLRRQLSFDLWYVFLGLFLIAIIEGPELQDPAAIGFTLFAVLFEIVSAYGTVGLSLGYPNTNASFCAQFRPLSKLVIIAMQIRGRHRGLPYELDRAILLPSESLHAKEAKEATRIAQRRRRSSAGQSTLSAVDGSLEGQHFRAETGLSSGARPGDAESPVRRTRTNPQRPPGGGGEQARDSQHQHHPSRHGIGVAMFKLATGVDSIKEEKNRE